MRRGSPLNMANFLPCLLKAIPQRGTLSKRSPMEGIQGHDWSPLSHMSGFAFPLLSRSGNAVKPPPHDSDGNRAGSPQWTPRYAARSPLRTRPSSPQPPEVRAAGGSQPRPSQKPAASSNVTPLPWGQPASKTGHHSGNQPGPCPNWDVSEEGTSL